MADILTQIQDELDMLLHQMMNTLKYIETRAPPSAPPGQPLLSSFDEYQASQAAAAAAVAAQSQSQSQSQPTQTTITASAHEPHTGEQPISQPQPDIESPVSPEQLVMDVKELSQDLVVKEQQLEFLINRLPGIGSSEHQQVERMRELERQLADLEGERQAAVQEKEGLVRTVEESILSVSGI